MKIKNLLTTIVLTIISIFTLTSCTTPELEEISLIAPTGTPTLLLGKAIEDYGKVDAEIVSGPTALGAAFAKGEKDIIVAPINLGAKLAASSNNFKYVMFHTLVWCNYYIVSEEEITSFSELDQKDVTVFGLSSTPDIIFKSLVEYHNIKPNVTYVGSVNDANNALLSKKANIIVSAEPAMSALLKKGSYHVYSLADAWEEMSGKKGSDIPQAAIFVKKESIEKTKEFLEQVMSTVQRASDTKEEVVAAAKRVDELLAPSEAILIDAIDRCNYKIAPNEKESINIYFQKVIDLGLGASVGGKLPDESFYYQK